MKSKYSSFAKKALVTGAALLSAASLYAQGTNSVSTKPSTNSPSASTNNLQNVGFLYGVGVNAGNGGVAADTSIQYKTGSWGAKAGYEQGESGQAVVAGGLFDVSPLELDLIVGGYAGANHSGVSVEARKSLRQRPTSDLSVGLGAYSFDFDGEGASGLNANIEYARILNPKSKRPITWRTGADYFSDDVFANGNFSIRTGLSMPLSGMTPKQAEQDMRNYLRTHSISVMNQDLLKGKSEKEDPVKPVDPVTPVNPTNGGNGGNGGTPVTETGPSIPPVTDPSGQPTPNTPPVTAPANNDNPGTSVPPVSNPVPPVESGPAVPPVTP